MARDPSQHGAWAQHGGSRSTCLLLAVVMLTSIASVSCADETTAVSECRRLYATDPQSTIAMKEWSNSGDKDYAAKLEDVESPSGWLLQSELSFRTLDTVYQNNTWTVLCVGLVNTTSYTMRESNYVSMVMLSTFQEVPVAFVRLRTMCALGAQMFTAIECIPTFIPLPVLENIPQYRYSTLDEVFWTNFTSDYIGVKTDWILRLDLWSNSDMVSIPADWVYNMRIPSLQKIYINGNDWKRPDKILQNLPNLRYISLSRNKIEIVPEEMLLEMPTVRKIILGNNNISRIPNTLRNLTQLLLLDLTSPFGNATLKIDEDDMKHLPESLETLGLENTKLQANVSTLFLLPNLWFVNFSGCALDHIQDHLSMNARSKLHGLDLSRNRLRILPQNILTEIPDLQFLDLSKNNLTHWPKELLRKNDLKYFFISHNHITNISSDTFENLKQLSHLKLSWNEIANLSETAFQNMQNLVFLDISHNNLTFISDKLFSFNPKLTEIYMSHNKLKQVPHLWKLHIKILDLSNNNLTYFTNNLSSIENVDLSNNSLLNLDISSKVLKMNASYNSKSYITPMLWTNFIKLKELDLGGNDFECCLFGNRTYLNEQYSTSILNLGSSVPLTCSVNQASPKILLESFEYADSECDYRAERPLGIIVGLPLTVLIMAGAIAVLIYVYRYEVNYVIHLFKMKKVEGETDEQRYATCVYDAFVCYSAKNFEWVMCTLLPGLEDGAEGYRLCVHDRDFALGAEINRNIIASLEKSRKVIFVLSADFIASKWCQWELELANHKMFEEKRNYIILVELERLNRRSLPRHLRYLMDHTTYLEWPEGNAGKTFPGSAGDGKQLSACFRRLRKALGDSLQQRTGRENGGFFTVLDDPPNNKATTVM